MKRTLDETFYVDFNIVAQSDHAYYTSDDLCVVTRFSPHHDFRSIRMGDLLLAFCHKGRMRLSLNGREHRLGSTDLLICLPSTLISDVEQSADCEGGMVFVSKQLLENSFRNAYNLFEKYLYISENPVIHLGEAGLQSSSLCFQALREKITQTERPYQKEIVTLLLNTDKTIKEISLQLGFPNLSFFGKYIKAKLGTSPTRFRASARQGE